MIYVLILFLKILNKDNVNLSNNRLHLSNDASDKLPILSNDAIVDNPPNILSDDASIVDKLPNILSNDDEIIITEMTKKTGNVMIKKSNC